MFQNNLRSNYDDIDIVFICDPFKEETKVFHPRDNSNIFFAESQKWKRVLRKTTCSMLDLRQSRHLWIQFLETLTIKNDHLLIYWDNRENINYRVSELPYLNDENAICLLLNRIGVPWAALLHRSVIPFCHEWWLQRNMSFGFAAGWTILSSDLKQLHLKDSFLSSTSNHLLLPMVELTTSDTFNLTHILGNTIVVLWDMSSSTEYFNYISKELQNTQYFPKSQQMSGYLWKQFLDCMNEEEENEALAWKKRVSSSGGRSVRLLSSPYLEELWRSFLIREAVRYYSSEDLKGRRLSLIVQGASLCPDFGTQLMLSVNDFYETYCSQVILSKSMDTSSIKKTFLETCVFISKNDKRESPLFVSCGSLEIKRLQVSLNVELHEAIISVDLPILKTTTNIVTYTPMLFLKQMDLKRWNYYLFSKTSLEGEKHPKLENRIVAQRSFALKAISRTQSRRLEKIFDTLRLVSIETIHPTIASGMWHGIDRTEVFDVTTIYVTLVSFGHMFHQETNCSDENNIAKQIYPMLQSERIPTGTRQLLYILVIAVGWGGTIVNGCEKWKSHIQWTSLGSQIKNDETSILFASEDVEDDHVAPFLKSIIVTESWNPYFCNVLLSFVDYLKHQYMIDMSVVQDQEEATRLDLLKYDCFLHFYYTSQTLLLPAKTWKDENMYRSPAIYSGGAYLGKYTGMEPFTLRQLQNGFSGIGQINVVMLVRNNADYLARFFLPQMARIEKDFYNVQFHYAFLENGSTDSTRSILLQEQKRRGSEDTFFIMESMPQLDDLDELERSHRIGILRNLLCNEIQVRGLFCNETAMAMSNWVLLFDSDIIFTAKTFTQLFTDAIQYSETYAAVVANIREPKSNIFYDTLSFNYGDYFCMRENFCTMVHEKQLHELMMDVETCFGGMMLIRKELYDLCRWGQIPSVLVSSSTKLSCEHYHFCRMLQSYGKIGISLLSTGTYIEHWSNDLIVC